MKGTEQLHELGQSIWLDNVSRQLLQSGTLRRYRDEFSVTGVTSNPTIFDNAITKSDLYDESMRRRIAQGMSIEDTFLQVALEDLTEAADLFRPAHDLTGGLDGWVSMEVSPLLADDATATVRQAKQLSSQAARPNLFVKIPGTEAGAVAIEEAIFAGVPINVTLLFSREHYLASAEAYMRGLERRVERGLSPDVPSVASLFVSRWDRAVMGKVPESLRARLGIAISMRTYKAHRDLLATPQWRRLADAGAKPQRMLWASMSTKDPAAPDTLYVDGLVAPNTIITLPDETLLAFADHGKAHDAMPADGGDAEEVLRAYEAAGINVDALAEQLQRDGVAAFVKSWQDLMSGVAHRGEALVQRK